MEKRIISLLLAISLLFSMLPSQALAAEENTVYLNAEAYWPSDQYDYAVWAWPSGGDGHWLLPQGPADANGWVTFLVDESNLLFVALNKGTEADWNNKAYQTGDLTLDLTQPYYILTGTSGGKWEESSCLHQWSSQITAQPSCTATGTEVFTCALCGSSYAQTLPRTDHNWQDETCTDCGTVKNMVYLSAEHMFPEDQYDVYAWVWPTEGDGRWVTPASAQTVAGFTAYPVEESDYGLSFVVFAQGQEPVWDTQVCQTNDLSAVDACYYTLNNYTYGGTHVTTVTVKTEACDHTWATTSQTSATCTDFGTVELLCSLCQQTSALVTQPTGHSAQPGELTVVTPPTCTENGLSTYVCETCQGTVEVTVPPTGHSLDGDGNCTVCDLHAVVVLTDAQGGTQTFGTFLDALDAATILTGNVTLTLMEDCTWTWDTYGYLYLPSLSLTLDLNGHCLSLDFAEENGITFQEMHLAFKNGALRLENGNSFFRTSSTSVTMEDITITRGSGDVISSIFLQETGTSGVSKDFVFRNVTLNADLYTFLYLHDAALLMEDCTIHTGTETNPSQNMVALVNSTASLTLRGSGRYHQLVTAAGGGTLRPFLEEGLALKYIGQDQYADLDTNRATDVELATVPLVPAMEERYETILNRPITITPGYTPGIEDFDPDAVTFTWDIPTTITSAENQDGSVTLEAAFVSGHWLTLTLGYKGYTAQKELYVAFERCAVHEFENGQCTYCRDWEIPQDSDGDGFYEIYNMGNLYWFLWEIRTQTGLSAKLMCDIDMEQKYPTITTTAPYTGTFDGQGHTVSNIKIVSLEQSVGFFPWTQGATIRNLGLSGSIQCLTPAEEKPDVGGVVGSAGLGTTIQNCWTDMTITGGIVQGGICGGLYYEGVIEDCRSQGTIQGDSGTQMAGGIVGINDGTVQRCISSTRLEITEADTYAMLGGIAGDNGGTVQNCANYGIIATESIGANSGGIVGHNYISSGIIRNCCNIPISGESMQRPIQGSSSSGTVENCYYLTGYGSNEFENSTAVTADQLASGEVAYLLNGSTADETSAWRQTLGTDAYPMLSGPLVYYGELYHCDGTSEPAAYRNQVPNTETPPHDYQNSGLCSLCGVSNSPAVLNDQGYYEIDTPQKLWWFSWYIRNLTESTVVNAVLTADIDLSTTTGPELGSWIPIMSLRGYYSGHFDGQGHTISGLYMDSCERSSMGLFGFISMGTIENLGVTGQIIAGEGKNAAGIVVSATATTIRNCWADVDIQSAGDAAGICVNLNNGRDNTISLIENCRNLGDISGTGRIKHYSGIVADCYGIVRNCANLGDIQATGEGARVGGIAGELAGDGTENTYAIENCFTVGTITAVSDLTGPVAGYVDAFANYTLTNNYYLSDTATTDGGRTAAQFASGEVAYALNGQTTADTNVWRQALGTDALPGFSGPLVYSGTPLGCDGKPQTPVYANTPVDGETIPDHTYGPEGLCIHCRHSSTPAEQNADGYYVIDTPAKLWWFAWYIRNLTEITVVNAVLTADIDLSTTCGPEIGSWMPIDNGNGYEGHFDGQGHTISNLYADANELDVRADTYLGLFGLAYGATIENLGVTGQLISIGNAGGIAANGTMSTIRNCWTDVEIKGSGRGGGIVGLLTGASVVENCRSLGDVAVGGSAGGIASRNANATIRSCASLGNVTSTGSYAGGIVGAMESKAPKVENCYAYGTVTGPEGMTGPIVGLVNDTTVLTNNYYLSDTATSDGGRTADQFASGQVAYELNASADPHIWGQAIGTDTLPQLSGPLVYQNTANLCTGVFGQYVYANAPADPVTLDHRYGENGLCTLCRHSGTPAEDTDGDGYYEIDTPAKLWWFAQQVNALRVDPKAVLTADIDMSTTCGPELGDWEPIHTVSAHTGCFDGQGHTISNLYMAGEHLYVGLFGQIYNVTIENLGLTGSLSSTMDFDEKYRVAYAGGIVAEGNNTTIRNCWVDVTLSGESAIGGICGILYDGLIEDCTARGTVTNQNLLTMNIPVGGIVGTLIDGTVRGCVNEASVSAVYVSCIGGIAGANYSTVESCRNLGTVTGNETSAYYMDAAGGIAGNNTGVIRSCANLGTVTVAGVADYLGGIAGGNYYSDARIENCYNTGTLTAASGTPGPIFGDSGDDSSAAANNYYLSDTETDDGGRTADQFASGEVAYTLNGQTSADTNVWRQTLGTDLSPVFDGPLVYFGTPHRCDGTALESIYSNTPVDESVPPHSYGSHGLCTVCRASSTPAEDTDGDGYYEIDTPAKLWWFAQQVNGGEDRINAVLTADIDLSTTCGKELGSWVPIEGSFVYRGHFNGQGYTISNLYCDTPSHLQYGLFGTVNSATIENLTVTGQVIAKNKGQAGGIVAKAEGATIRNCQVDVTVQSEYFAGGIVGSATHESVIENCRSQGQILLVNEQITSKRGGGLVGNANDTTIRNCASLADVSMEANDDYSYAGGLAGYSSGTIENSYSLGTVTATGGLTGPVYGKNAGTDTNNFYLSDTATNDGGRTADQFASGRVAYELNRQTTTDTSIWRQTIGTDPSPVHDGPLVYKCTTYRCDGIPLSTTFANTNPGINIPPHTYGDDGICTVCRHSNTPAVDSDGDGFVEIDTPAKLWWFAQQVDSGDGRINAVLTADIDMSTTTGPEIGSWPITLYYRGHFNGQGHTISNLYGCTDSRNYHVSLFATVERGTVENLGVTGQFLSLGTGGSAAGIAGSLYEGTIRNCWTDVEIQASNRGGGICANIAGFQASVIENCRALGSVTVNCSGQYALAGGILAAPGQGTVVRSCANLGTVTSTGNTYTGGIIGGSGTPTVENCYNAGTVTAENGQAGPLRGGSETEGTITNSYYLSDTATDDGGRTADQFASGEVAYALNGQTAAESSVWRQTIGTDPYPLHEGPLVYYGTLYTCDGTFHQSAYRNEEPNTEVPPHQFVNGFCSVCDAYEEAALLDGVYQIANGGNLFWFSQQVASEPAANALVTAGIDLENREWKPIDNYAGTFDGGGHSITNLSITIPATRMGFFGRTISPAVIQNFTISGLIQPTAGGDCYIGGVAVDSGDNEVYNGSTISNVVSLVNIDASAGKVTRMGGILTSIYGGTVSNCLYLGTIQGSANDVGGIVGYARRGHLENCGMAGSVSSTSHVGGILGYVNNEATYIRNCYVYGPVIGTNPNRLGAIIGRANTNFVAGNAANNYYNTAACAKPFGPNSEADMAGASANPMAAASFHSGQVTWLLNGSQDNGIWKQTLDGQSLPGFSGDPVYRVEECDCGGSLLGYQYRNTPEALPLPDHSFDEQGTCFVCQTQMPIRVTIGTQDTYHATFQEALTKAQEGTEAMPALIQLLADVDTTAATMTGGVATLELNGYSATLCDNPSGSPILTVHRATLTIQDSSQAQTGSLTVDHFLNHADGFLAVKDGAQVEWKSGTLSHMDQAYMSAVYVGELSRMTLSGGTVLGGVDVRDADFIMLGGEVLSDGVAITALSVGKDGYGTDDTIAASIRIEGGSITAPSGKYLLHLMEKATATITGGTFATVNSAGENVPNVFSLLASVYGNTGLLLPTITLEGGTFLGGLETAILNETDPALVPYNVTPLSKLLAEGYGCQTEDGTFVTLAQDQTQITESVTVARLPEVVRVDITWGDMAFTYTDGDWDPDTLTYGLGTWAPDAQDGDIITVTNSGTLDATVSVTYAPAQGYEAISGRFALNYASLSAGAEQTFCLTLSGKPETRFQSATLGTITLTIGGE